MNDALILSFPVLKQSGGDFVESVAYEVEAVQHQNSRKLIVTHTLRGDSFISQLIKDKKAVFSVSLFYKDNAERQTAQCEDFDEDGDSISAEQEIKIDFSYAPEITPHIVLLEATEITADAQSGLTDFWRDEVFTVPAFSRIAHYSTLKFTGGDVLSLSKVNCEPNHPNGSIEVRVSETLGEGEQPITINCAQDVFDELRKGVVESPFDAKTAFRAAIITQILCHVYAYMNHLKDKEVGIHSGLSAHMDSVLKETEQDWQSSEFNASFAATKMQRYAIEALNNEDK